MKTVLLGSGTGALFTMLAIRKHDREAELVVVDEKDFELLHPCGIPYVIEGRVDSLDKLKGKMPALGQTMMLGHSVVSVNTGEKKVEVENLGTHERTFIDYDNLVICTGSSAVVPPVPGADLPHVFKIDSHDDAVRIKDFEASSAVIVGAGAIGLETAYALRRKGLDVTIVEMLGSLLPKAIDPDMSALAENYLKSQGINIMLNSKLESIEEGHVIVDGNKVDAGMVILSVGVKPNTGFLDGSGVEVGKWGIVVNERMQTNVPGIYAVGDCVQVKSLIDGRDWMMQLAVAAYKQGTVAGMNICGRDSAYRGALTTFASRIGDIEVAATGFNSHFAGEAVIGKSNGYTKPEWCGDASDVTVKLLVNKEGKILGGQAVGAGAAERINVVSAAISAGMDIFGLSSVELCYCPAVSETYDVLMQAADNAIRRLG